METEQTKQTENDEKIKRFKHSIVNNDTKCK